MYEFDRQNYDSSMLPYLHLYHLHFLEQNSGSKIANFIPRHSAIYILP